MYALPAPTGPHPVGVATLTLLDPLRADPWNGEPRELAASVYYPAADVAGCPVAPYMTAGAAAVFVRLDAVYLHPELPTEGVDWTAVRTHAHVGPPPAAGPWPVVVYSPGGGDPRALATSTAEELASHGRVVITVDHPGDSSEIEYPDGRVRTMAVTADPRVDLPTLRTAITARVADLATVLDVVFAAGTWPPTGGTVVVGGTVPEGLRLDPARVGMMGHSGGATAATQAMHDDPRVRAGVNLEGYLDYIPAGTGELLPVAREGLDRPLLLLGTDGFRDARLDRTWLPLARRDTTELVWLPDSRHRGLSDLAALAPQLRDAGLMTAEDCACLVGTGDPLPQVRRHVVDFFARHL